MSRRRILIIGGTAVSLTNFNGPLITQLVTDGHEVHTAAPDFDTAPEVRSVLDALGVAVHSVVLNRTGINPVADLRYIWSLWRLMRRIKPDLMLGYTIKPVIYGLLAGWAARVPARHAKITGLGYAFTGKASGKRALIRRIVRAFYRLALKRAHSAIFLNPDDRALFQSLGLLPEHIPGSIVNGSGVDLDHFAPTSLPSGPVRFLVIARLLGDKGLREYAEAARLVRPAHPEVGIHLVGDPDSNPDAIPLSEVQLWVKEGLLTRRSAVADVRPAIAAAHVFVLPSYREGIPRTVLEAMAMGRPVITTDAPGCRETVVDGESGWLVPPGDIDALAGRMIWFAENPDRVADMGAAALARCREKYDANLVNQQIMTVIGLHKSDGTAL